MIGPLRFLGFLGIALFAGGFSVNAQEKKKEDKKFKSTVIELNEKSPAHWLLKEAKVGAPIVSERDYAFAELPEEIIGGTLLLRSGGDDHKTWLKASTLNAIDKTTVYAIVRWKYLGKEVFGEVNAAKLERDGWKEVKGDVETTFPSGEDWRWRAYKKEIKKGEVILQLKTLSWPYDQAVLFVFK